MGVKRCGLCKTREQAADGRAMIVLVLLACSWVVEVELSLGTWCGLIVPSLLSPSPNTSLNASRKQRRDWMPVETSPCPWSIIIFKAPRSIPWVRNAESPEEACEDGVRAAGVVEVEGSIFILMLPGLYA